MSGDAKMTRRREKNKISQQNGSDMPNPSLPSSASSSPEGHQDPPQLPLMGAADEDKVLKIIEKSEKYEKLPLVLWRNPIMVLHYSTCELVLSLVEGAQALLRYKVSLAISAIVMGKICQSKDKEVKTYFLYSYVSFGAHYPR